jgi:protein-disulfide isomerase
MSTVPSGDAHPVSTRHVQFGWALEVPQPIDRQAYLDLGVANGPSQSPPGAPVTVVSFLDIGHPWGFARKSLAAWREVLARYPRDVRLVVKLCPLSTDHGLAAEAVHAAGAQGAFWPMLDRVAASPERQALDDLVAHARALDLDASRLRADLERRAFRDAVEVDRDHQLAMEIEALPHALVNGRRVHGALPAETWLDAVEQALRRARIAEAVGAR